MTQKEIQQNVFANQPVSQTATYGDSSAPSSRAIYGNFVTKLHAGTGSGFYLTGLKLEFDNGTEIQLGHAPASDGSQFSIDLTNDSIDMMYAQVLEDDGFDNGVGISGLYLTTTRGEVRWTSANSGTPITAPDEWIAICETKDPNPLRHFVLLGAFGRFDQSTNCLGFYFKKDRLLTTGMTEVEFSELATDVATPLNISTATVTNRTDEEQVMSVSFAETVSNTLSFSTTAGIEVGLSTKVRTGIPYIVDGEVEVSASVSLDITIGVETTVEKSFSYDASLTVPPGETISATATAQSYPITGHYSAVFSEVWARAGAVSRPIAGEINGVSAYDVMVTYTSS